MKMRLQKFMAHAGVASRRKSEEIISRGRVTVNGERITEMGVKIDPARDTVRVDGEIIEREDLRYIKLNKPEGVISSARDPGGRKTVVDYVSHLSQRLYPVGRLDYDSRGLILLTNDGELTNILTHPSYRVTKVYSVKISGYLASEELKKMEKGVELEDGITAPAMISEVEYGQNATEFKITLREGRKRQIRRMCQAVDHDVTDLKRLKIGPLTLGSLEPGHWRELSEEEENSLLKLKRRKKDNGESDNS